MSKFDLSRFCVLTAPFLHHTLEYGLDSIAANGFSHIELWGASPHFCPDDYDEISRSHRVEEICQMLSSRGLKMDSYYPEQIRQYPINIASPDPYIREKSLDYMHRCLEDTAAFGAPYMLLTPGWAFVDRFNETDTQRAEESVRWLAEQAATLGVHLVMEEQDPTTSLLCCSLSQMEHLIHATGIAAGMDIPLALAHGSCIEDYWNTFGSLVYVRLADQAYAALGQGNLDLNSMLEDLEQRGYTGQISISLWGSAHYPDPDASLRICRDWLLGRVTHI